MCVEKHYDLLMYLYLTDKVKVSISMPSYIKVLIEELSENITKLTGTLASYQLLQVITDTRQTLLSEEQVHVFHSNMVRLLILRTNNKQKINTLA